MTVLLAPARPRDATTRHSLPLALHDFRWNWDERLFYLLNARPSSYLDALARILSTHAFGDLVLTAVVLWLIAGRRRRSVPWIFALAIGVAFTDQVGNRLLKPWFGRMRPSFALVHSQIRILDQAANVGSMPSLHAADAACAAVIATFARPRLAPFFLGLAALIGWSRVRVGVHWPSDVLAGLVFGAVVGSACGWLVRLRERRQPVKKSTLPLV
jgi:undecaprenyl-diphosphatase